MDTVSAPSGRPDDAGDDTPDCDNNSSDPLERILEAAIRSSDGDKATVGAILETIGTQSLGPIVLLAGLLTIIPVIGMLPVVPFIIGLVVVLFSAQYIFGKRSIWVPGHIRKLSIDRSTLEKAQQKSAKWLRRLDALFTERLTFMTGPTMQRITSLVILVLGLSMFPLGMVPGGVALPGWAFIFFGVGLTARDGLFLLIAYLLTSGAAYLLYRTVPALL